jgi:uncharacterized protein (DUF58 family)
MTRPNPTVTIKPLSRAPLVVLGVLVLLALLLPHRAWSALAFGLGGLLGLAYLWAREMARGVRGQRTLRFGWVAVGDLLEEWFTVDNQSFLPVLWVEVRDHSTVPDYQPGIVRSVSGSASNQWRQRANCTRRGRFTLGPWALVTGDPFGLFEVCIDYADEREIIIHPPIHTQLPVQLPAGRASGGVQRRVRNQQAQLNAASVRAYRPNDPYRHIHWPTSARRGALHVRQFDQDAAGDVWLLLDMQAANQVGSGADSSTEQAILLAASLAAVGANANQAIGLAAYASQPQIIAPSRGQGHSWRLLRALALIDADSDTTLRQALVDVRQVVRRGAALLVVTATDSAEWLPALFQLTQIGVWVEVVLLDRASFGGSDNRALRPLIEQTGVVCTAVQRGEVGQRVATRRDEGRWEFRVTPMGKAVAVQRPVRS